MPADPYLKLISQIKKLLTVGLAQSQEELSYQRLLTNWKVGELITASAQPGRGKAATGTLFDLEQRIAKDIEYHLRYVQNMVQFYKTYTKPPKQNFLNWTHYQDLLTIKDAKERHYWEKRIDREKISSKKFRSLLKTQKSEQLVVSDVQKGKLVLTRGTLYLYRIAQVEQLPLDASEVIVDCGFHTIRRFERDPKKRFESGMLVNSIKDAGHYTVRQTKKYDRNQLYTYGARILHVYDGDTFRAYINLGFDIYRQETLRLKGVDAPEMYTEYGAQAKAYVEELFQQYPKVVIKSHGWDPYKRFIVDLYYGKENQTFEEIAAAGPSLNQELLDKELALVYT